MPAAVRLADESGQDHAAKACIESLLLHARNLSEFLIEGRYKTSDIHRSDFAPRWSPPNSPAKSRLRNARRMLDRNVSHLSWERVEVTEPHDDPERIVDDMLEVMGAFVEHLEAEANPAASWFDGQLQQARILLDDDGAGGAGVSYDVSAKPRLTDTTSGASDRATRQRHLPPASTIALRVRGPAMALARRTYALVAGAFSRFAETLRELRHWDRA
jgi:hypothetical protein